MERKLKPMGTRRVRHTPNVHVGENFVYLNKSFCEQYGIDSGTKVMFGYDETEGVIVLIPQSTDKTAFTVHQRRVGSPNISRQLLGEVGEYPRLKYNDKEGWVELWKE